MLHLLPEYQKRKVLTEYRLRLTVVLILLVAVAILMFVIFLMPTYVYLYSSKSELVSRKLGYVAHIQSKAASSTDKAIGDVGMVIAALKPISGSLEPLLYIDALAPKGVGSAEIDGIQINSYFLSPISDDKVAIMISGIADTREGLTRYSSYLNDRFGGVKLPLSSLAKQRDIPFDFKFEVEKNKFIERQPVSSISNQ